MKFLWLLIESFKKGTRIVSEGNENEETKIEILERTPERTHFKIWIYKFFQQVLKRDDVVHSDRQVESDRNDDIEQSKNPEHYDDFIKSLQEEIIIIKKEIIASSIASTFSTVLSHPIDVIKSNFQSLRYPRQHHEPYIRPRIIYITRHIYKTKGLRRFYRDYLASQRISFVQAISMFWTYQQIHTYLNGIEKLKNYTNLISFISGFISATIPVIVLYPIERLQKRKMSKKKILRMYGPNAVKGIVRDKNYFRGLYRGCFSLYMHLGILYGLRFLFYNKIRNEILLQPSSNDKAIGLSEINKIDHISNFYLLLAGGIAAVLGDLVAYPLEVVHSRIKMSSLMRQQYPFDQNCFRIGQCFKTILKNESILTFYAGFYPTMLSSVVNTAVQFAVHEKAKNWLDRVFLK